MPTLDKGTIFNRWISRATPGSRFIYHEGFLLQDLPYVISPKGQVISWENEVKSIASLAYRRYLSGELELVQRKCKEGHYQYIAQKRKKVVPVHERVRYV